MPLVVLDDVLLQALSMPIEISDREAVAQDVRVEGPELVGEMRCEVEGKGVDDREDGQGAVDGRVFDARAQIELAKVIDRGRFGQSFARQWSGVERAERPTLSARSPSSKLGD
jgi:hypothetical protein